MEGRVVGVGARSLECLASLEGRLVDGPGQKVLAEGDQAEVRFSSRSRVAWAASLIAS
jgi:hypothetical protein